MDKVGNAILKLTQDLSEISTNGSAKIRINENLCSPEEFHSLFEHFRKGTILEHLDVEVQSFKPKAECGCGYSEDINGSHPGYKKCPSCGRFAEVKDHTYELVEPDPSRVGKRQSIRF